MIQSGFFNSNNGDRRYDASFFAKFFGTLIGNGVFPNPSTGLQVYEKENMTVTVKPGKGWINGYFIISDSEYNLTLDTADGVLNRIDRIVMRLDFATREIQIIVKKGAFASSPVAPTLQRDADAYELALADIYVGKGVTAITQAQITDRRSDTNLCGIVHGLVNQVDTTTLFNQYQSWLSQQQANYETDMTTWTAEQRAEFEAWQSLQESDFTAWNTQQRADFDNWFASIKDIMDENVATNLQNQITELDNDLVNLQQTVDEHKTDELYQAAGGTATAIILTINSPLVNGYPMTFIASANNNGSATTINGKPLYKPNTTTAPTLIGGKAYTVWYNQTSDCFFIKASAEGTVTPDKVLAGFTFSNDSDTGLNGTMDLSNLTPDNIRKDVIINGVKGNKLSLGIGDNIGILDYSPVDSNSTILSGLADGSIAKVASCFDSDGNLYHITSPGNLFKTTKAGITTSIGNIGQTKNLRCDGSYLYAVGSSGIRKYDLDGNMIWSKSEFANYTINRECFYNGFIYATNMNGDILKVETETGLEKGRAYGVIGFTNHNNGSPNTVFYDYCYIYNGRVYYADKLVVRGIASLDANTLSSKISHGVIGSTTVDKILQLQIYKNKAYANVRSNDSVYQMGNIMCYKSDFTSPVSISTMGVTDISVNGYGIWFIGGSTSSYYFAKLNDDNITFKKFIERSLGMYSCRDIQNFGDLYSFLGYTYNSGTYGTSVFELNVVSALQLI